MNKISLKEKEYLEFMSSKSITRYIVMAVIGCILLTIGVILFSIAFGLMIEIKGTGKDAVITLKNFTPLTASLFWTGFGLMVGPGTALTCVGVPCWIALGIQIKVAQNKLRRLN